MSRVYCESREGVRRALGGRDAVWAAGLLVGGCAAVWVAILVAPR